MPRRLKVLAPLVLASALVAGCSSSSDNGDGGGGSCDKTLLPGIWSSARYSMQIFDNDTYRASGAPNVEQIDVVGNLVVDGCSITIRDVSGRYACPESQAGQYTFTVSATRLGFTLVSDPCAGRRIPLAGAVLARR